MKNRQIIGNSDDSRNFNSFDSLSELYLFLDEYFIPNFIVRDNDLIDSYSYISLQSILNLDCDDQVVGLILDYLGKREIPVKDDLNGEILKSTNWRLLYKKGKKLKMLDLVQQQKLFLNYYKTKDIKIRNELIEKNLSLVYYVIYKMKLVYSLYSLELDELVSLGNEGLIVAIERFNPYLGYQFSTYAYYCIRGYILTGLAETFGYNKNFYYPFLKARTIAEKQTGITLEEDYQLIDEILKIMHGRKGFSPKHYSKDKNQIMLGLKFYLNDFLEDENLVNDSTLLNVDYHIDLSILKDWFQENVDSLEEVEKEVLELYYFQHFTQQEIEKSLKIQRVSRYLKRIYLKILKKMDKEHIEAFHNFLDYSGNGKVKIK